MTETQPRSRDIARMLGLAFTELATAAWVVPDPAAREQAVAGQFEILVDHARTVGGLLTTGLSGGVTGALVWFDHTTEPAPIPDYERRLRAAVGRSYNRFAELDALMDDHHPIDPHCYVALVGVHPDARGRGIASGLLDQLHRELDRDGTPAYLEAVSEPTVELYRRHGYHQHGAPFRLGGDGPALHPMWREPGDPGNLIQSDTGDRTATHDDAAAPAPADRIGGNR